MIKIHIKNLFTKPAIKVNLAERAGQRFSSYKFKDKDLGKLTVDTDLKFELAKQNPSKSNFPNVYETKIIDEKGNCIGFEMFEIDNKNGIKSLLGEEIYVRRDLQQNGMRLGEKLRLSSIITMLENKINRILITSVPNAILFHSKYKFKPIFGDLEHCMKILRGILVNSYKETEKFGPKAEKLMERIKAGDFNTEKDAFKETSNLLEDFTNTILKLDKEKQKEYPFFECVDMKLTKEDVIKNSNYFNNLFKKHNLDYKI